MDQRNALTWAMTPLSQDVLQASKDRIRLLIERFDNIFVSFSGGKDSLVALCLVQEVYLDDGRTDKVNVFFYDEEIIPKPVVDFVQGIYRSGAFNMRYFCLQLESEKCVLGAKERYVQWGGGRDHMRDMPDFAITDPTHVYSQYNADARAILEFGELQGSKCVITGIRADESITRRRTLYSSRKNPTPWITRSAHAGIAKAKPLYDWRESDIWKYLHDNRIPYCPWYDRQVHNNDPRRVATPLLSESSKRIGKLKSLDPEYYQKIIELYPEMESQARYYDDFKGLSIIDKYPRCPEGIRQYIRDRIIDPEMREIAMMRLDEALVQRRNRSLHGRGGFPALYLFRCIVTGNYKRRIQPRLRTTKTEQAYEKEWNDE